MTDYNNNDTDITDRLVEFTDRIMAGEPSNDLLVEDNEFLRDLQKTVIQLRDMGEYYKEADDSLKSIKRNVTQQHAAAPTKSSKSWWERMTSTNRGRGNLAMAISFAVLMFLVVISGGGTGSGNIPGAATDINGGTIAVVIIVVAVAVFVIRQRNK